MPPNFAYKGRFAPTPSGPLHFGSLVAALASYLDAKAHHGKWLIRIEDVDSARSKACYIADIETALAAHGFISDEEIRVQSAHLKDYAQALARLKSVTYPCNCSRKEWHATAKRGALGAIYPRLCRTKQTPPAPPYAIRLALEDTVVQFQDRRLGKISYSLQHDIGDPILKRRDGDFAYALAVVVDDALQGISDIVRGEDLLATTAIQLELQRYLQLPTPRYLHLPLVLDSSRRKLSKQNHAPALDNAQASANLIAALRFLGQDTTAMPPTETPATLLEVAVKRWNWQQLTASQQN